MRALLDENLPRQLKRHLASAVEALTVQLLGQLRRRLTKEQLERLVYAVADAAHDTVKIYQRELRKRGGARNRGILLYHSRRGRSLPPRTRSSGLLYSHPQISLQVF